MPDIMQEELEQFKKMRYDGREIFDSYLDPGDPYSAVKRCVHLEECIAWKSYVGSFPGSFEIADDELAFLKGSKRMKRNDELDTDDLGCSKAAAEGCALNVIHIFEGRNKVI